MQSYQASSPPARRCAVFEPQTAGSCSRAGAPRRISPAEAVGALVRAWLGRRFAREYARYRDLLRFHNAGDPRALVATLIPAEVGGSYLERAARPVVRFRLRADFPSWPPRIVFRVGTLLPVCDVNSFAPRVAAMRGAGGATVDARLAIGVVSAAAQGRAREFEYRGPHDANAGRSSRSALLRVGRTLVPARVLDGLDYSAPRGRSGGRRGAEAPAPLYSSAATATAAPTSARAPLLLPGALRAPADLARSASDAWYMRDEGATNPWRELSDSLLAGPATPAVADASSYCARVGVRDSKPGVATGRLAGGTPTRLPARGQAARRRRLLVELYLGGDGACNSAEAGAAVRGESVDDRSADAEALFEWATSLDYEAYLASWLSLGASCPDGGHPVRV
jgi:hypothetical protein